PRDRLPPDQQRPALTNADDGAGGARLDALAADPERDLDPGAGAQTAPEAQRNRGCDRAARPDVPDRPAARGEDRALRDLDADPQAAGRLAARVSQPEAEADGRPRRCGAPARHHLDRGESGRPRPRSVAVTRPSLTTGLSGGAITALVAIV